MQRLFKFKRLKDPAVRHKSLWYEGTNNVKKQVCDLRSCIQLAAYKTYEELV